MNCNFLSPTKLYFGIGEEKNVGRYIKEHGFKKVMFHYGQASIKKTGLYDVVKNSLNEYNVDFIELGGVEANPDIKLVRTGIRLCKDNQIDFILAVGGGSVIDSAKSIANGYFYDGDPYDFNLHIINSRKALPIGVILTIAAAGSEMSNSCVISDVTRGLKKGFNSDTNRPLFVIENPELTYTVPANQTAYGIVDIISHSFERYFNKSASIEFADYLAEGIMKAVMDAGEKAILEPTNYDARATLMVASSYSHNGLTGLGKPFSLPIHQLEHELSGFRHDISHGGGLACLMPAWMKVMLHYDLDKLVKFALNVMGVEKDKSDLETAKKGIEKFEDFLSKLNIPLHLSEYGISNADIDLMVSHLANPIKGEVPLTHDLAKKIYQLAF